jgi:hypothetical protein
MMHLRHRLIAAAALAALPLAPATAGWKLAAGGTAIAVAKSTMTVTPGEHWSKNSYRPIKKSEVWTIDGLTLNELYFVSGLAAGEPLFREFDKKNNPLPKMNAAMLLTDVPEFFESSARIAMNTSLFEVTSVAPAKLGGHDAVKFSYRYSSQGSTLMRQGVATGTVVKGQLYLINFAAPSIHYFARDAAKAEAIMASARI